jgi:hypothetical protein
MEEIIQEKNTEIKEEKVTPSPSEVEEAVRYFPMEMSDNIGELAKALSAAQGACSNGAKDKQGYGYKYMTLDILTDIIRPNLTKNNLSVLQSHELNKGKNPSVVTHTMLMHESGQYIKTSLELPLHVMKQLTPAQMIGVCCTYGRRYTLQSIFMIAAEEDTDGTT